MRDYPCAASVEATIKRARRQLGSNGSPPSAWTLEQLNRAAENKLVGEQLKACLREGCYEVEEVRKRLATSGLSELSVAEALERLVVLRRLSALRHRSVGLLRPRAPSDWVPPCAPPAPADYNSYEHVAVSPSLLVELHPHERDRLLRFEDEGHVYFINGKQSLGSVTALIHSFCEEFVATRVISRMCAGPNWPRPGYLREKVNASTVSKLYARAATRPLASALVASERDEERICELAKCALLVPEARSDISEITMSAEQIRDKWDAHRCMAASKGTYMHQQFELWLNRYVVNEHTEEMGMFLRFVDTLEGLTAYRTEWAIYADEERLAGSIDFVAQDQAGNLVLFDWKRTAKIVEKFDNKWRSMFTPLSHLPDCSGVHYRLQLNMYKLILEKYYGVYVTTMFVVCTHPDNAGSAFVDCVPPMAAEAAALLEAQRRRAVETASMEKNDFIGKGRAELTDCGIAAGGRF